MRDSSEAFDNMGFMLEIVDSGDTSVSKATGVPTFEPIDQVALELLPQ